jgi:hypothetical protein
MRNLCLLAIKLLMLLFCILACTQEKSKRSFYYWKSTYQLTNTEKKYAHDLRISKLYVRFFDVDWDENIHSPVPIAKLSFRDSILPEYEVIPVVYIVNKVFEKMNQSTIEDLKDKIYKQIQHIARENNIAFAELQIDCDWTESTRVKFFSLLKILKSDLKAENKILSATIRLHQVKYINFTGVPPVDRGMLMYYNMGKISDSPTVNSIYSATDAEKYLSTIYSYPLPLDIALPAYSWGIHIRKNKVIELLNNMNYKDFEQKSDFEKMDENHYQATKSFYFKGFYFMKDDIVKVEEITPDLCQMAARQIKKNLGHKITTVAIFHLDSLILSNYEEKDFEKVFDTFN